MKSVKKLLKLSGLLIAAAILIIVVVGYFFGEWLIKIGVETAATRSLAVGVYVGDVDIKPVMGQVAINNLVIRNPNGYTLENLLKVKSTSVAVKVKALMGDPAKIQEVKISGIDLVLEQKGFTNNLKDLVSNIPSEEETKKQQTEEKKPAKKLQINDLVISDIHVELKMMGMPAIPLNLGDIHLTNLGGENGIDSGQLARQIVLSLTKGIAEDGKDILPMDLINGLQGALQNTIQKTLEGAGKLLEKGLEPGKDAGQNIINGVKGLFEKKK